MKSKALFATLFKSRFSVLFSILSLYIVLSLVVRVVFLFWSMKDLDPDLLLISKAFFKGFFFDLTVGSLFLLDRKSVV